MSKLNPQKASAYVGPGVLRKGGKITKVPNGPLVKKKGPYAGSTLKTGGAIKKAQVGDTIYTKKNKVDNIRTNKYVVRLPDGSIEMGKETKTRNPNGKTTTSKNATKSALLGMQYTDDEIRKSMESRKNGGPIKKAKAGGMIKRADGSYSKRGLWDNIRANKGSGKKPTAAMLKQEKKIKAKTKK
jgi:hypothetical protein